MTDRVATPDVDALVARVRDYVDGWPSLRGGAVAALLTEAADALEAARAEIGTWKAEALRDETTAREAIQALAAAVTRADATEAAIAARDALLDEALRLKAHHVQYQNRARTSCRGCLDEWPCPTERWRRAVTELRGASDEH